MIKLQADAMLGGLARWLRVLGLDAAYDPALDDAELVDGAAAEGRVILTRDRRLVRRRGARNHLLIRSEVVDEQVVQVLEELRIEPDPRCFFSRCLRCNAPLREVPAAEAAGEVPPFVARTQERFRRCPTCCRIYWRATHVRRMRQRLARMGIELTPAPSPACRG